MPKRMEEISDQQTAIGSYIAQASEGSSASVNVYEQALPHPVEQAVIDAARQRLTQLPLETPATVDSPPSDSRLPPFDRNPLFVGREGDLHTIASLLKAGERATVVVTGMGGLGKSQLANEFIHRYGRYFLGGVFWLSFADAVALPTEIAACHLALQRELRLDTRTFPLEEQAQHVLSTWQNALPRLLAFDNCEEEALLVQWRPPTGGCRVLVTSRRASWSKDAHVHVLPLGELEREESVKLLGEYRPDFSTEERSAIAEELGDLPLAVNLAGNYLEEYQESPLGTAENYLTALRQTSPLLHRSLHREGENYNTKHVRNVARTFALSYERLDRDLAADATALNIVARAAQFAPGVPIARELLRATMGPEEDEQVEEMVVQALKRLTALGLLEKQQGNSYRLHRLLAAFVRFQSSSADTGAQTDVEQALLTTTRRLNQAGYPAPVLALQSHLRFVCEEALQRGDELSANLCHELAYHLYSIGAYTEAGIYCQKALAIYRRVLGEEHPDTATSLNHLALLYYAQGKYEQAEPLLRQALIIRQRLLGEEHPNTATSLNNLASLYHAQGQYEQAEPLYQQALAIRQRLLGEEHPDTAQSLNNLALLYYVHDQYEQAEPLLQQALTIAQRVLGEEHPQSLTLAENYNYLLEEMKREKM